MLVQKVEGEAQKMEMKMDPHMVKPAVTSVDCCGPNPHMQPEQGTEVVVLNSFGHCKEKEDGFCWFFGSHKPLLDRDS